MIYNTENTQITSVSSSLWCHMHTAHAPQQSVARASCPKMHHRYTLPPCTASFLSSRMTLHDKHGDRCTHHPAWLTNGFNSRTQQSQKDPHLQWMRLCHLLLSYLQYFIIIIIPNYCNWQNNHTGIPLHNYCMKKYLEPGCHQLKYYSVARPSHLL